MVCIVFLCNKSLPPCLLKRLDCYHSPCYVNINQGINLSLFSFWNRLTHLLQIYKVYLLRGEFFLLLQSVFFFSQ